MDHTAAATLMAWLDREVWLITAHADSRRGGLIATFVNPASIVPDLPRMVIGLSRSHHTTALIEASGACALHLLGEQHLDLVWRFGLQSGRDVDKFAGLDLSVHGPTGSPILGDAIGWLDCRVEARQDAGDRSLFLLEVVQSRVTNFAPPLTQKRLTQLASPHHLKEMQRQRHCDSLADAEAIRQWRMQNHAT